MEQNTETKKLYRVVVFQNFHKYIKARDSWTSSKSVQVAAKDFNSEEEAQAFIDDQTSNSKGYNPAGAHYEKIAPYTFKLTYAKSKTYRILSYQICEFYDEQIND
jgi:hypothetical protein